MLEGLIFVVEHGGYPVYTNKKKNNFSFSNPTKDQK